jgi:hypothetical protein
VIGLKLHVRFGEKRRGRREMGWERVGVREDEIQIFETLDWFGIVESIRTLGKLGTMSWSWTFKRFGTLKLI